MCNCCACLILIGTKTLFEYLRVLIEEVHALFANFSECPIINGLKMLFMLSVDG